MRRLAALLIAPPLLAACKAPGGQDARKTETSTDAASAAASAAPAKGRNVSGQVIHLQGDKLGATDPMPPSPHGHGEALRAVWAADDGTAFAVGFMFTGTPARDTGAVYRRAPGGSWQVVHSTKENELGRVFGRSADDVWAAGMRVLAHWDGKTWSEVPVPNLEGLISAVWGNAEGLWVTAGHQFTAHVYHRDAAGTFTHELKTDVMLFALGSAGPSVWAAGTSGSIFRRDKDGHWKKEHEEKGAQFGTVWANAEDDVWAAGSSLLHSRGDGTWTKVDLPTPGPARYVWGRGKGDVFVGVAGGIYHLEGERWGKTAFTLDSAGMAASKDDLLVLHNDIH
jgi:hypothetical protein